MKTSAKKFLNTAGPIIASALIATAIGCAHKPPAATAPVTMDPQTTDLAIVDAIRDTDVRTAIVTEHTLFPYHFVVDSDSLNALGRADMAVLLEHYRSEKGTLNVRHGEVSDELYASRVKRVQEVLAANGIAAGRVEISDGLPGGDGMNAYNVARAMARSRSQSSMQGNTNNSSDAPKGADSASGASGAASDSSNAQPGGGK
jgi:hypothetical protein